MQTTNFDSWAKSCHVGSCSIVAYEEKDERSIAGFTMLIPCYNASQLRGRSPSQVSSWGHADSDPVTNDTHTHTYIHKQETYLTY